MRLILHKQTKSAFIIAYIMLGIQTSRPGICFSLKAYVTQVLTDEPYIAQSFRQTD